MDDSLIGLLLLTANPLSFDEGETIHEKGEAAGGTFALIASGRIAHPPVTFPVFVPILCF